MSHHELRRRNRIERHLCAACRGRRAKYQYRGHVRADRSHVLCFQCFRSAREQMRARQLVDGSASAPQLGVSAALSVSAALGVSASSAPLTLSQIEHRRRMLTHLQAQALAR